MGGASKASQSGLCKSTIGLCERHNRIVRRVSDGADAHSKRQLEVLQKSKTHRARKTGDDALRAGLTALPFHCPLLAAGLLRWPAWPRKEILRADTGSGRSRTARGGAVT